MSNEVVKFTPRLNELLVPSFIIDLDNIFANLWARSRGLNINGDDYDVLLGTQNQHPIPFRDYIIPVITINQSSYNADDFSKEAFDKVRQEFRKTRYRRHFIATLEGEPNYIIDVLPPSNIPSYSQYRIIDNPQGYKSEEEIRYLKRLEDMIK